MHRVHVGNDEFDDSSEKWLLKCISYACVEGMPQSFGMKGTYILNILALLLYENLQRIY